MEQNSTQEPEVTVTPAAPVEPVAAPVVTDKKTTIQVFASTTKILLVEKRGNDTYDDVIRRDRKVVDSLRDKYPDIYKELNGTPDRLG